MDFYKICRKMDKKGYELKIYPDFKIGQFNDFMVRGKSFYAIWNPETGLWSTNEYVVREVVDKELNEYYEDIRDKFTNCDIQVAWMSSYNSRSWRSYCSWIKDLPDNYHQLDNKLIFQNTDVKREDYASKRLPYSLAEGNYDAFDEIIGTLYEPEERAKLEWAIGAVVSGDSIDIQKFIVLYGEAGAGKSTILNIIQQLFQGYYTSFEAKALASNNNSFSTEVFKTNPLVAIQHDGDLSRIEDNTKLNSIISHEEMTMNEKYKSSYTAKLNCFLFMATNRPVKITDAKSGIIRRLIDVEPSGKKIESGRYRELMNQIKFELGAIAYHCLQVYKKMGKDYYGAYRPVDMMYKTDVFFNFVEDSYLVFDKQDGVTLKQAYDMYKVYCDDTQVEYRLPKYKFREELKNYFRKFDSITRIGSDNKQVRNYYGGFLREKFSDIVSPGAKNQKLKVSDMKEEPKMVLEATESLFDTLCCDCPAQYATSNETPSKKWSNVRTTLKDISTNRLHYVKVPENHIVIDFDIKGDNGEKSADLNLKAAAKWPETYAEFSKGGAGVHLHYIYDGDVSKLSRVYSDGIEIKVFNGNSALRRRLSRCNDVPVAHISSGLPLKGDKVINFNTVKSERSLRNLITKNLQKEIHPGTKPSIDFIYKILEDAYDSGLPYDITDMRPKILAFANNSSHQAPYCIELVSKMKFKSEHSSDALDLYSDERIVFFDVEVFPNLFLVNWKYAGKDTTCVRMINPTSQEIEQLINMKLVGFNCRRYDNHILYARYLGYSNIELYNLSQKIISGSRNAFFGEAYNISYTDVYDFASAGNKKSLKKWEIELGLHHKELGLPWDEPVPEDKWVEVAEYCDNDVISTEAVFNHLSGDWTARQILAELSGLSVNDTTNQHSTKIIFGNERHPQSKFVYTDLSEMFPGYKFERGKSYYRGEEPGEGGYVYSEPGMYTNVALLDIASMHPSSIEALNLFGDEYTKKFSDIKQARIFIKHKDYKKAETMLDGRLAPFIEKLDNGTADFTNKDLSNALKTVINSIYGLTSAKFENPFRDPRNIDNIVAKRGALFMIDLKYECQNRGWTVVHIKTDSIKLGNATKEMIDFVIEFGKKYGYTFEHEATYDRMCIVNDAVYIAKYNDGEHEFKLPTGEKVTTSWTATGAQFQEPYVFKTLFSNSPIVFNDLCATKSVTSSLYLDMNESLEDVSMYEKELVKVEKERKKIISEGKIPPNDRLEELKALINKGHEYIFIGKVGNFCPIKPGCGGGILVREKDGKYYSVTGTKGYRWLESETVLNSNKQDDIDRSYYNKLVDEAVEDISKYGDFEWFISEDDLKDQGLEVPWCTQPEIKDSDISVCEKCPNNSDCMIVKGISK